jgi:hypothetical protein
VRSFTGLRTYRPAGNALAREFQDMCFAFGSPLEQPQTRLLHSQQHISSRNFGRKSYLCVPEPRDHRFGSGARLFGHSALGSPNIEFPARVKSNVEQLDIA